MKKNCQKTILTLLWVGCFILLYPSLAFNEDVITVPQTRENAEEITLMRLLELEDEETIVKWKLLEDFSGKNKGFGKKKWKKSTKF